ncbi:MAG: hypothetical protein OEZ32_02650 [Nitrospinota bacterium]|nr:hypothetical protein [Nitrospinota bacterium]
MTSANQLNEIRKRIEAKFTDAFLDGLMEGMDIAFGPVGNVLLPGFKDNIKGYDAKYLFTAGNGVSSSAIFKDGKMSTNSGAIKDWDTRVSFSTPAALRDFLLSKDQDILNSILKNEVAVDGNLAMIYRFGFISRDLMGRLGIGQG